MSLTRTARQSYTCTRINTYANTMTLINKFMYLGSNISSIESNFNISIGKTDYRSHRNLVLFIKQQGNISNR